MGTSCNEIDQRRMENLNRFEVSCRKICEKYGREFEDDETDIIDLRTLEIIENRGSISKLPDRDGLVETAFMRVERNMNKFKPMEETEVYISDVRDQETTMYEYLLLKCGALLTSSSGRTGCKEFKEMAEEVEAAENISSSEIETLPSYQNVILDIEDIRHIDKLEFQKLSSSMF